MCFLDNFQLYVLDNCLISFSEVFVIFFSCYLERTKEICNCLLVFIRWNITVYRKKQSVVIMSLLYHVSFCSFIHFRILPHLLILLPSLQENYISLNIFITVNIWIQTVRGMKQRETKRCNKCLQRASEQPWETQSTAVSVFRWGTACPAVCFSSAVQRVNR